MLHKATGYMDHLEEEAIEILLNTRNFNRDSGFNMSQAWCTVDNMLYNQKAGSIRGNT
jgi:hypothetical protein